MQKNLKEKTSDTFRDTRNPNKIFGSHDGHRYFQYLALKKRIIARKSRTVSKKSLSRSKSCFKIFALKKLKIQQHQCDNHIFNIFDP